MNRAIRFALLLACAAVAALPIRAHAQYPFGADVVRTASPTNYAVAGGTPVMVATTDTQRVNCYIEQLSTNPFWVCETLTPTNASWYYVPGTVGSVWETKRPALWKGPITVIPDSTSAAVTSKVSVIEGVGSY
jgi:hypothetical protein